MSAIMRAKSWFRSSKKHHQPPQLDTSSFSSTYASAEDCSPAASTMSPPPSASASANSTLPSFKRARKSSSTMFHTSSPLSAPPRTSRREPPEVIVSNSTALTTKKTGVASRKHMSSIPTVFANISLPSLHYQPIPSLVRDRNSSFQSLPIRQSNVLQQIKQQEQDMNMNKPQIRMVEDLFAEMALNHKRLPPLPPSAIKIPGNSDSIRGSSRPQQQQQRASNIKPIMSAISSSNTRSGGSAGGHSKIFKSFSARFSSSMEAIPAAETVAQEYARTIKALWQMVEDEELAYQIDAAATAARQTQEQKQQQQLRSSQTAPTAAIHANQARHRYTAFPLQQEYPTTNAFSSSSSIPIPHSYLARDSGAEDETSITELENRICREQCCCPRANRPSDYNNNSKLQQTLLDSLQQQDQKESYPSWTWDRSCPSNPPKGAPSSAYLAGLNSKGLVDEIDALDLGHDGDENDSESDDEFDTEEERECRTRELEELERELTILGLQRYQDSSDSNEIQLMHRASQPPSPPIQAKLQIQVPVQAQPQLHQMPRRLSQQHSQSLPLSQTQPSSPSQSHSPSQILPKPYQRKRQNSLAYEERRAQQDTRWQSNSKPTSPISPMSSKTPGTVNFFDGIDLDEDSDENEDGAVLAVAHRVSVRHHADWSLSLEDQGQQHQHQHKLSWDAGRGVSWTPLPRQQPQQQQQHHKLSPRLSGTPLATRSLISAR